MPWKPDSISNVFVSARRKAGTAPKEKRGSERVYSLGHPACPTPKAAVSLSEQQPYNDRLQCTIGETSEIGGWSRERKGRGRWKMAREEKEEQLSDYCRVGSCW